MGYAEEVATLSAPLENPGDFDRLLDRVGAARVVMLGEASHGTHEFYRWRAELTRRLIAERGFRFVAVEGDWPDCDRVDRAVRGRPEAPADPRAACAAFARWPTWMWANEEVVEFCRWLRGWNLSRPERERAGFHGLDVYSLWESIDEILTYLQERHPDLVESAWRAYRCFEPYSEDPAAYAWATRFVPEDCEDEVVTLLTAARKTAGASADEFGLRQNAEVVAGAERYYRAMVAGGAQSWNVRDRHMADTLDRLLAAYGPAAKGVVWAHNTHVGDARATDMAEAGEVNIGQLARDRYGRDQVVLVGFGTYQGRVIGAEAWGAPMATLPVPAARPGSLEAAMHEGAPARALLIVPPSGEAAVLGDWLGHRAVGVVYHPHRDHLANYVPTRLGDRYDAFCWFDQTRPVRPLHVRRVDTREVETYPVGV